MGQSDNIRDRDRHPLEIGGRGGLDDFLIDYGKEAREAKRAKIAGSYYEDSQASAEEIGSLWQSTLAFMLTSPTGLKDIGVEAPQEKRSFWQKASDWLTECWETLTGRGDAASAVEEDEGAKGSPLPGSPRLQGKQEPLDKKQIGKFIEEIAMALEQYRNGGADMEELRQHHTDLIVKRAAQKGNLDSRRLHQEDIALLGQQMMTHLLQNRELMQQINAVHGSMLSKAELSKKLSWVAFGLTAVFIVCSIVAAVATAGASAGVSAAVLAGLGGAMQTGAAAATVAGGGAGIAKGVNDYMLNGARGEFGEKQTNRDLNLASMDSINAAVKEMMNASHRFAVNAANHARSVQTTIAMMYEP